ncbi:hypothetical protein DITRI_Ditri18aG0034600 [Diplodiscus trichospermus]
MVDDKKAKVKKGWLAVEVGLEEDGGFQRFVIPISYLYHPLFKQLLDKAHEVYGYHTSGPLRLPCSTDDFLNLSFGDLSGIVSCGDIQQRGRRPFRFQGMWLRHANFMKIVKKQLDALQLANEGFLEELHKEEVKAASTVDKLLLQQEIYLKEQSRIKWLKDGTFSQKGTPFHQIWVRGVRQVDPLYPLLFVIDEEYLSKSISYTVAEGIFATVSGYNQQASITFPICR